MSQSENILFDVVQCAYRNGALDKLLNIVGESTQSAMDVKGDSMMQVLALLDDADPVFLAKLDALVAKSGEWIGFLNNDKIMQLVSYLLDDKVVRGALSEMLTGFIATGLESQNEPAESLAS